MKRLLTAILMTLLLAGCTAGQPSAPTPAATSTPPPTPAPTEVVPTLIPTPTPGQSATRAELLAQLDAAEKLWQQADITSYTITVNEIHSIWSAQTNVITVENGIVTDLSNRCIPAPSQNGKCTPDSFDGNEYTIPALFGRTRNLVEQTQPEYLRLAFDQNKGYPIAVSYDAPQILDDDFLFGVTAFESLPGLSVDQLGETVMLHVGESAQAKGLTLEFVSVKEDSRCPASVACVWAGQVVVELQVTAPNEQPQAVDLTIMGTGVPPQEPVDVGQNWTVQLTAVIPYPKTPDGRISAGEYQASILVSEK